MTLKRLSQLRAIRVRCEDGSSLGHLFELRSPGAAETQPVRKARDVECLLVGRQGLLERLGWKVRNATTVPWTAVIAMDAHGLTVRGTAKDYLPDR